MTLPLSMRDLKSQHALLSLGRLMQMLYPGLLKRSVKTKLCWLPE